MEYPKFYKEVLDIENSFTSDIAQAGVYVKIW